MEQNFIISFENQQVTNFHEHFPVEMEIFGTIFFFAFLGSWTWKVTWKTDGFFNEIFRQIFFRGKFEIHGILETPYPTSYWKSHSIKYSKKLFLKVFLKEFSLKIVSLNLNIPRKLDFHLIFSPWDFSQTKIFPGNLSLESSKKQYFPRIEFLSSFFFDWQFLGQFFAHLPEIVPGNNSVRKIRGFGVN